MNRKRATGERAWRVIDEKGFVNEHSVSQGDIVIPRNATVLYQSRTFDIINPTIAVTMNGTLASMSLCVVREVHRRLNGTCLLVYGPNTFGWARADKFLLRL